jgi:sugar phosphate isomerase/epimerase
MPKSIQLSGAAWSFVGATLQESVGIYRALGINALDLIALPGTTLDSYSVVENPAKEAKRIKSLNIQIANLIFNFSSNFSERAVNHRDPTIRRNNLKDFQAVMEFCQRCSIPSVTVLPGVFQKRWSREKSLEVSAEILNELTQTAAQRGVVLTFEAHVGSILESPNDTLVFLQANAQLRLTLDYSHFIFSGHAQEDIDLLIPYAAHVHLRQGAKGTLQPRWENGVIDFAAMLHKLEETRYKGYLTIEYEHDSWLDLDRVDVITETIKMRNLVHSVIS